MNILTSQTNVLALFHKFKTEIQTYKHVTKLK